MDRDLLMMRAGHAMIFAGGIIVGWNVRGAPKPVEPEPRPCVTVATGPATISGQIVTMRAPRCEPDETLQVSATCLP